MKEKFYPCDRVRHVDNPELATLYDNATKWTKKKASDILNLEKAQEKEKIDN